MITSEETIACCFKKAGISVETFELTITDEDVPFQQLQKEIDIFRSTDTGLITGKVHAESVVGIRFEVVTFQSVVSNSDTVSKSFEMDDSKCTDDSVDGIDKVPPCPINLVFFKP